MRSAHRTGWAAVRRANLDASLGLLAVRARYLRSVDARGRPAMAGVEVIGIGLDAVRRSLRSRTYHELLSIGTDNTAEGFDACRAADYELMASGIPLVSLYDYASTDETGKAELQGRRAWGNSYYCSSAIQLKVVDRCCVVMEIPPVREARTVIAVSDRAALVEALRYFRTVRSTAVPVGQWAGGDELPSFTERQWGVIRLLSQGYADSQIALALQVGVPTVRYDISAICRQLGVASRFAAGVRLAQLGMAVGEEG